MTDKTLVMQVARDKRPSLLSSLPFFIVALTLLPVLVVASSLLTPTWSVWQHLWDTILPELLLNTAVLLLGVGIGTLMLGTALAWLVTAYEFPGKKTFEWLLVLPMAMPAYIMGFVYMAIFDFAGPVQTLLRAWGLETWGFWQIRSGFGAITVMTLVLYPYVYLLAKAGFAEQSGSAIEAAKVLGSSKTRLFFQVVMPLARPSIVAGVSLALMEALADFATVRYFNFPTVADGILRVWHGLMDLGAASEMAGLLAMLSALLLLSEHRLRNRRAYHQIKGKNQGLPTMSLSGWRGGVAVGICSGIVFAAFGLPLTQLLVWGSREIGQLTPGALAVYVRLAGNSLSLAAIAAVAAVAVALLMASLARLRGGTLSRLLTQVVTTGYALPGAVIAVGILLPLSALDRGINTLTTAWWGFTPGLIFTGSIVGLIYAYTVRFMAVAYNSVDSSLEKIPPNTTLAARVLGASTMRLITEVQLPLIMPGIMAGAILVFVDVMKELPITMMLRPLGYDTLAIWVWQMAAESLWASTALPALAIVLAGLIPIKLLLSQSK
ncbi:MAG: Sulfate transport system permease protein CysW [Firmicutes bacterium]|nr:Sulfate transport system permease protein CysW [Bacillota bacterium]